MWFVERGPPREGVDEELERAPPKKAPPPHREGGGRKIFSKERGGGSCSHEKEGGVSIYSLSLKIISATSCLGRAPLSLLLGGTARILYAGREDFSPEGCPPKKLEKRGFKAPERGPRNPAF